MFLRGLGPFVLLVGALLVGSVQGRLTKKSNAMQGALNALPLVLFVSFTLVPGVTIGIFQAWDCLEFQLDSSTTHGYLREDLRVRCTTASYISAEHDHLKAIGFVLIAIWPIGLPAIFTLLLVLARKAIFQRRQTALFRATSFLHHEVSSSKATACNPCSLTALRRRSMKSITGGGSLWC